MEKYDVANGNIKIMTWMPSGLKKTNKQTHDTLDLRESWIFPSRYVCHHQLCARSTMGSESDSAIAY